MTIIKARRLLINLGIIGFVAAIFFIVELLIPFIARCLIREEIISKPGVIVVTGGYYGMIPKLLEVYDLYKNGLVEKVIVPAELKPEGLELLEQKGLKWPTSSDISVSTLLKLGLPDEIITVQPKFTNGTFDEAIKIRDMLCDSPCQRIILVTDKYHSRRAYLTFFAQLYGLEIEVQTAPSRYDKVFLDHWWEHKRDLNYVISEWIKMIYYWLFLRAFTKTKFNRLCPLKETPSMLIRAR